MLMAFRLRVGKQVCVSLADVLEVFHEATDLNPRFEMPVSTAPAGHLLKVTGNDWCSLQSRGDVWGELDGPLPLRRNRSSG